jgi:hypothetical protein
MDFDPRSIDDSRDRNIDGRELNQGSRGGLSNPRERERLEPRDVFTRDLELPRGRERQRVWARDSDVTLRGSEVRTLATVGAFRVVPAGDLRDGQDRPLDPHRGDLRHLKDSGLVETIPAIGEDRALVVLTERGRDVLERNRWSSVHAEELRWEAIDRECGRIPDDGRDRVPRPQQEFHVGVRSVRHTRFAAITALQLLGGRPTKLSLRERLHHQSSTAYFCNTDSAARRAAVPITEGWISRTRHGRDSEGDRPH